MSNIKRNSQRKVACLCGLLMLILSGCANMTDADRTKSEATLTGAGIGAVIGQLVGDSKESTAAGAVVGGLIGGVVGSDVAKKKEAYMQNEERLREIIAQAENSTNEAKNLNAKLEEDIKALELEKKSILANSDNKLNQQNQLKKNHQSLGKIISDTKKFVGNLNSQIASLQKKIDDHNKILVAQKREPERGAIITAGMKMNELMQERAYLLRKIERVASIDKKRIY